MNAKRIFFTFSFISSRLLYFVVAVALDSATLLAGASAPTADSEMPTAVVASIAQADSCTLLLTGIAQGIGTASGTSYSLGAQPRPQRRQRSTSKPIALPVAPDPAMEALKNDPKLSSSDLDERFGHMLNLEINPFGQHAWLLGLGIDF
jgi:hypothetical protein